MSTLSTAHSCRVLQIETRVFQLLLVRFLFLLAMGDDFATSHAKFQALLGEVPHGAKVKAAAEAV